ncbi:MAG: hypothetical protein J0I20_25375 [Chloroflexi bacterium]|nr:hypothetical protein [Chloroflexota bacterium]OJW02023.1 MAG: hypothetical protein BGO39_27425 [Chloroflexi bacterium 54-19]
MKKYEREIREILEKMDTFVPDSPPAEKERNRDREPEREPRKRSVGVMPPQPVPIRPRRSATYRFNQWLTSHHIGFSFRLMLAGLGLVIVALIINEYLPGMPWLAQLIGAIGAFVFVSPVLIRFFRGRDLDNDQKYWRGQVVESDSFSWSSLRNWLGGRRKSSRDPWKNNNRNRNNNRW